MLNSIVALYLLAYAVQHLGPQITTLFSPLVPLIATLMAMPLLGEFLNLSQWMGVILVTLGILGMAKSF